VKDGGAEKEEGGGEGDSQCIRISVIPTQHVNTWPKSWNRKESERVEY